MKASGYLVKLFINGFRSVYRKMRYARKAELAKKKHSMSLKYKRNYTKRQNVRLVNSKDKSSEIGTMLSNKIKHSQVRGYKRELLYNAFLYCSLFHSSSSSQHVYVLKYI